MASDNPGTQQAADAPAPDATQVPDPDLAVLQVLRDLETPVHLLPVEALRAAQQLKSQIVPGLIDVIRNATRQVREGREPETNGHFFALILLIEFRAKEAWPVILEAMSLPEDGTYLLFGDAKTEVLPHAVATLAYDRIEEVVSAIRNLEIDEFVRWSLMSGLAYCVAAGIHSREEIVNLLRGLLRECLAAGTADNVLALISTLIDLYPAEAYEEIKRALDEGFVWKSEIHPDEVSEQIDEGEEVTIAELIRQYEPITDTVGFLQTWACFQPRSERPPKPKTIRPSIEPITTALVPPTTKPTGIRHSQPHIRRNDPCPCGSGKKFKKCCGRSAR